MAGHLGTRLRQTILTGFGYMVAKAKRSKRNAKSRRSNKVVIVKQKQRKTPAAALVYKMGRMGIQRSNPAAEMTYAVAKMIMDPCNAKLTSGGFGYGPTSINRFVSTYTFPTSSSPPTNPYTCGYIVWFPGYSCPKLNDAVPTTGGADGSLFVWASPSSSTAPRNAGGNNINPSEQFGRGLFDATDDDAPKTTQSIATPDYPFLNGVASSHQLISACIGAEFLGPALSAGGEIFAINGVDPGRLLGGVGGTGNVGGNCPTVDEMAILYGSSAKAIRPGSEFETKFFSRSPNSTRRLTVGEGVCNIQRSTTADQNRTVITTDCATFTPLGFGIGWRNVPVTAVPGSTTAITSGVKDLRFKFTVIKEWNAVQTIGLGQHVTLPTNKDVHSDAVNVAAETMARAVGSSFHEVGPAVGRILANPTAGQVINETISAGSKFLRAGMRL